MTFPAKTTFALCLLVVLAEVATVSAAIRVRDLIANDIVYDPINERIYASVPSRAGLTGNSVAIIDPLTGSVETTIFVGSEPSTLALSDNSEFLYVALDGAAAIRRVNVAAQLADLQFPLGSDPFFGPFYAEDIEVLPGSPEAVAVSLKFLSVSPRFAGVAIYDNGVARPDKVPGFSGTGNHVNVIEFSTTASKLYGASTDSSPTRFSRMAVDEFGVSFIDDALDILPGAYGSGDIEFEGGLIYSAQGALIDPEPPTLLGTFLLPSSSSIPLVQPDPVRGLVHFLTTSSGNSATVTTFNLNFLPIDTFDIMDVDGTPGSLVRWGEGALAFLTSADQLFFIDEGPPQPVCDLELDFTPSALTLQFELATPEPVIWNLWLSFGGTVLRVWTRPLPMVDPKVSFDVPIPAFPSVGKIGFLTTFVSRRGITCSDWEVVDTGNSSVKVTSSELLGRLRRRTPSSRR